MHRGTKAQPGLVLGLDRGGSCRGVAFRVAASHWPQTLADLRARELVTQVYHEVTLTAHAHTQLGVRPVQVLTYVADRQHPQYAGRLPRETVLAHVRQGQGISGDNGTYVRATHAHLQALGVTDPMLAWLSHHLPVQER